MSEPLKIYTIFEHPLDYPNSYVVRVFHYDKPTQEHWVCPTLEVARSMIPEGLVCFTRHPSDEPQIVESWL